MTITSVASTTLLVLFLSLETSSFSFVSTIKARPLLGQRDSHAAAVIRHSTASSSAEVGQADTSDKVNVDTSAWANGFSNCEEEISPRIISCPDIPDDFPVGTYYRNGHGRFTSDDGVQAMHPFDGDGLMSAITFDPKNKRILFRNKFIETKAYMEDKRTGTMSQRGIFGTKRSGGFLGNLFRADYKNIGNTNVLHIDGKLYALWEGGRPHLLDPLTLKNVNGPGQQETMNGILPEEDSSFAAHPRYDPTNELWINFGVKFDPASGTSTIGLFELDANTFECYTNISFAVDGPVVTHDFVLTENYCIFNFQDCMVNQENAIKAILGFGAFVDVIDIPKVDETSIVMIPRALFETSRKEGRVDFDISPGNTDGIKTIKIPFHFNFHYANGFEDEQGRVVFDTVQIEEATLTASDIEVPEGEKNKPIWETLDWGKLYAPNLVRYTLDLENECMAVGQPPKVLSTQAPEFPSVPDDLSTKEHRYVYQGVAHIEPFVDSNGKGSSPLGGFMKVDTKNPSLNEVYTFEPWEFVGEAKFVAKVGKNVTVKEQEDAGYIISYVLNGKTKTTDFVMFDVEGLGSLQKGPVCRFPLPTFIPHGLHGSFGKGITFPFDQDENFNI